MSALTTSAHELISLCQTISSRIPIWTQGFGGNLSVKEGDILWIKASGARLGSVSAKTGLAAIRISEFHRQMSAASQTSGDMEAAYSRILGACSESSSSLGRPSMETGFHAILPQKYAFHFHSLPAVLMAEHLSKGDPALETWLASSWHSKTQWVPAIRPGWLLAEYLSKYADASSYLLQNHGVILQSDTPSILSDWEKLEREFCAKWNYPLLTHPQIETQLPEEAPLKVYFPDTAVFLDQLQASLLPSSHEGFFKGSPELASDQNLRELWLATRLLYRSQPDLTELPEEIRVAVTGLPTELIRKNLAR